MIPAMRIALTAITVTLLASSPALSQALTAGALRSMCTARDASQQLSCTSYLMGYVHGRNLSDSNPTICIPGTSPVGSVVAGFLGRLQSNPLDANLPAGLVLGDYLVSTYPCGK